jgi:hypothetical protein
MLSANALLNYPTDTLKSNQGPLNKILLCQKAIQYNIM